MKKATAFVLLIVFAGVCLAQSPGLKKMMEFQRKVESDGGAILHSVFSKRGELPKVFVVTKDQITASPKWDGKAPPPLPFTDAIDLARKHLAKTQANALQYDLWMVVTKRIESKSAKDRWCYDVSFARENEGKHDVVSIYVLMDETILEPQEI
jgi:hypothetical protein